MAVVYLINSELADTKQVLCSAVQYSGSRAIDSKPTVNGDVLRINEMVEVLTQSAENPKIALKGITYTGADGTLTIQDVLTLYKQRYNGNNATTLYIVYGDSDVLPNYYGETNGISCVLQPFNITLSTRDSRHGYRPTGDLTFVETK